MSHEDSPGESIVSAASARIWLIFRAAREYLRIFIFSLIRFDYSLHYMTYNFVLYFLISRGIFEFKFRAPDACFSSSGGILKEFSCCI